MKEIAKNYNSQEFEQDIYKQWEESGMFNPDNLKSGKKHFSIVIPPPNATGVLHLGHAAMLAYQDAMVRYHRMLGENTLWVPGTDHAAIATQNVVEKKIAKEQNKTKEDLGRESFLDEVKGFVAGTQDNIRNQIRAMGSSVDWSRERYTLSDSLSQAVNMAFKKMYDDELIYRGHRIVNWCPRCHSTLSNDEVEYKTQKTPFYYFKYGPVVIGTARPETKFADKVIIVHPDDKRFKDMVGKKFTLPWIEGDVEATIIADESADPELGSGAMTITPAHSFVDYELAKKYDLEVKKIIDEDGNLTDEAGQFAGMNAHEARERIVEAMDKKGLVDHIDEDYEHNLSVCYRCDTAIEPLPSEQWFVDVNKKIESRGKSLKEMSIDAVKSGDINIMPDKFEKVYYHWMNNLHDWCISRQIWWGHRIPVWYKKQDDVKISFVRHGKTDNNIKKVVTGREDVSVSTEGINDIKKLAKVIDKDSYDAIFISPLKRTRETAEAIFGKQEFIEDERLTEIDFGDLGGDPIDKVNEFREKGFPGGESYQDVIKRVKPFLEEMAEKYAGKHIMIVNHRNVGKVFDNLIDGKELILDYLNESPARGVKEYVLKPNKVTRDENGILVPDYITELIISRHGVTDWVSEGIVQGSSDTPLDEQRIDEIKKIARDLKKENITKVISSPLMRARQTAEIFCKELGIDYEVDELATERDYGAFEGKSVKDIHKEHPDYIKDKVAYDIPGDDEESYELVMKRGKKLLSKIDKDHPGEKVLIVSHNAFMRALTMLVEGKSTKEAAGFKLEFGDFLKYSLPNGKYNLSEWKQDEDTLDTWFSSALWTFSTMLDQDFFKYNSWEEWVNNSPDLKKFHPTSVMETGYDILFFWVARMIIMTTYLLDEIPFETVYLHGLIRDKQGKKMSKSLGNGIDPIEMIDKFGADALRLSMMVGATPGNDMRLYEEKIEGYRNFVNKLWNVSRYIMGSVEEVKIINKKPVAKTIADDWILSELDELIVKTTKDLDDLKFSPAIERLYEFTWSKFADWYIEISKVETNKDEILLYVLEQLLKMWHPFAPYVTEVIWQNFDNGQLIVNKWPNKTSKFKKLFKKDKGIEFNRVKELITAIRNAKGENKIDPAKIVNCKIDSKESSIVSSAAIIEKLAKINLVSKKDKDWLELHIKGLDIALDIDKNEAAKIQGKQKEELEKYIIGLQGKLNNDKFVSNAPADVVSKEREKLAEAEEKLNKINIK